LISINEVAEETYSIEVILPGIDSNFAVYFIREGKGALIEPGPAAMIPSIQEAMKQLGMKDPAYVIPTHIHLDHGGAIGSLSRLFPHAKILLHPRGAKHVINPTRLVESTKMAFGDDFEDRYGPILAVPERQVETPPDGTVISLTERELQIIYAPGHAPHHMAIFDLKTKGLFSGEALGHPNPGAESLPLPTAAPPSFDIEVYLETMEKLKQLRPRVLFYSHDGVGNNPDELISVAFENTKIFGDIILEALKKGEDVQTIESRLNDFIAPHVAENREDMLWGMTIRGYIHYFQKKGLT
jgi:glyoxylase-like metal-dependent hydrolase (beta-lactamase superfamily II)